MEITDKLNNWASVLAFAKLVEQGCSYFSRILIFLEGIRGPAYQGAPGLSPASPIVNPALDPWSTCIVSAV